MTIHGIRVQKNTIKCTKNFATNSVFNCDTRVYKISTNSVIKNATNSVILNEDLIKSSFFVKNWHKKAPPEHDFVACESRRWVSA